MLRVKTVFQGELHRITLSSASFDELRQWVRRFYGARLGPHFVVKYRDEEDDLITVASDEELAEAFALVRSWSSSSRPSCSSSKSSRASILRVLVEQEQCYRVTQKSRRERASNAHKRVRKEEVASTTSLSANTFSLAVAVQTRETPRTALGTFDVTIAPERKPLVSIDTFLFGISEVLGVDGVSGGDGGVDGGVEVLDLCYVDDEEDEVTLVNQQDLDEAVALMMEVGKQLVVLVGEEMGKKAVVKEEVEETVQEEEDVWESLSPADLEYAKLRLQRMGFTNRMLNEELLEKYRGKVALVIEHLQKKNKKKE